MAEAQRIKTDEQALEAARLFAKQIRGESTARDRERRLPVDEIESFSQTGLWGITVPKEYGGPGVSTTTFTEVVAIVSEADASIGQIPQNHYANVEEIRLIGTEAQKKFFFDRILKGERLGNAAVERSGKNVIANQTRLEPDGDGYRLSGEKFYCTGALFAHWVPVRVTNADGKRVLAIVNRHSEGLTVIDDWSSFGQRTTASGTVVLKDVRVSPDQILPSYEAYQRPTTRGPFSQIIHVAIDVGIARAAIADTIEFVKNRSRPWIDANVERASDDPLTIQELGKLQYQLHAAEALMERSALKVDR
ncbi:MAG TPA: SfnB family sulfur acquisition oxidoreductase, partial [Chthoniobacterales bacterium]|nr:SfnB family sulfur acquisition oxidoreductase [Chthoniobacterales bacterium]